MVPRSSTLYSEIILIIKGCKISCLNLVRPKPKPVRTNSLNYETNQQMYIESDFLWKGLSFVPFCRIEIRFRFLIRSLVLGARPELRGHEAVFVSCVLRVGNID